nr:hypothetical protein [Legionella waltersii]
MTDTSTRPAVWAGVTAFRVVLLMTTRLVAETPPMVNELVPVKLVPVTVTPTPPEVEPTLLAMLDSVGGGH